MCNKTASFVSVAILSLIACIFFLIGASGHGDDEDTVTSVPWGFGDFDGIFTGDFYLGLQGYVISPDSSDDVYEVYNDDDCDADFCETCEDAGAGVVALCVLALVMALIAMSFGAMGAMSNASMIAKAGSTGCSLVAAVFGIVAFAIFRPCIADFVDFAADAVIGESTGTYGVGGWLSLLGFILMCIATLMGSVTFCLSE